MIDLYHKHELCFFLIPGTLNTAGVVQVQNTPTDMHSGKLILARCTV